MTSRPTADDVVREQAAPVEANSEEKPQMLEALGVILIMMSSVGVSYLLMLSLFKLIHLLQSRVV